MCWNLFYLNKKIVNILILKVRYWKCINCPPNLCDRQTRGDRLLLKLIGQSVKLYYLSDNIFGYILRIHFYFAWKFCSKKKLE